MLTGYAVEGPLKVEFPVLPFGRGGGVMYVYRRAGGVGGRVRHGESLLLVTILSKSALDALGGLPVGRVAGGAGRPQR